MYRFRTAFELSPIQIKDYIKVYEKHISKPIVYIMLFIVVVCLLSAIYFFGFRNNIFAGLICFLCAGICVVFVTIIRLIIFEYLWQKNPFAIGSHITLELDEFLHVNCSGQMKSYMKGSLKKKILKNGDYILYKKRDIVVIPYNVLTRHIKSEIDSYF